MHNTRFRLCEDESVNKPMVLNIVLAVDPHSNLETAVDSQKENSMRTAVDPPLKIKQQMEYR